MTKDHSTTRSKRIHQFMRLLLAFSLLLMVVMLLPSTSGAIFTLDLSTFVSLLVGFLGAEVADWIMWGIAEALGGKNGLFAPNKYD